MPNILRAQKRSGGERLKEHPWFTQYSNRLQPKAANSLDLFVHFAQLGNAIGRKCQTSHGSLIFSTRVGAVGRLERVPNIAPNMVLLRRVRRLGNIISGLIAQRELGDAVAARSISRVPKARMIRTELNDLVAISGSFVRVQRNDPHVGVISQ